MIDSSGIGLLIAAGNSLAEKKWNAGKSSRVERIFQLLGSMRLISRFECKQPRRRRQSHE